MNELSRIPPVQLPITTIATNITQTPQPPLDEKVSLGQPEKIVIPQQGKQKKNQVAINERHWTMLKERREIDELRELQIVLLFSQLLKQGLSHLQEAMTQIFDKIVIDELKKSIVRHELPIYYQEVLAQLVKKNEPVKKQLKFLVEKAPHLIESHQGYWQIKNRQKTFPIQIMLATFETEFSKVTFPNTLEAEAILEKKTAELIALKEHLAEERKKNQQEQGTLKRYEEKFEEDEERRIEKQEKLEYWKSLVGSKEIEYSYVHKKVQEMAHIHPLKRRQHEYQAYVLREQIVEQELTSAESEVKKAAGIYRVAENQAIQSKKDWTAIQEKEKAIEAHLNELYQDYQKAIREEQTLKEKFQREFYTAYENLNRMFEQYLIDIYEEEAKTVLLEKYYREQLKEVLKELKQILKQEQEPIERTVLDYIKQGLTTDQTATLLSQANADAINVQHLLGENR